MVFSVLSMRRFATTRRFSTVSSGTGSAPPSKGGFGRKVLFSVAAFGVGSVAGVEAYLYLFAPPHHRSHWELLRSVGLAAIGRPEEESQRPIVTPVWSSPAADVASQSHDGERVEEAVVMEIPESETSAELVKEEEAPAGRVLTSDAAQEVAENALPSLPADEASEIDESSSAAAPSSSPPPPTTASAPDLLPPTDGTDAFSEEELSSALTVALAVLEEIDAKHVQDAALLASKTRELDVAKEELEGAKLDLAKLEREMERKIAVIRQDMQAEYVAALESRVEIERVAAEDRKNRDLSVEIAHHEKLLEEAIRREEKKQRAEGRRDHSVRMEALRDLYEEIVAAESVLSDLTARLGEAGAVFAAAEAAGKVHDGLRLRAPFGKSSAKGLAALATHSDPVVREAALSVPARVIESGAATDELLLSEFDKVAKAGLQAALVKNDRGIAGLVSKALGSLVRPAEGMVSGSDADSVFARARVFLERDNLGAALKELEQLKPEIRVLLEDFSVLAFDRLAVDNAVAIIKSRARVLTRSV